MATKKQLLFLELTQTIERVMRTIEMVSGKGCSEMSGITLLQIRVMDYMKNNPETLVRGISEYLFMSPSSVSQLTDRLFAQKLIDRKNDPDDRRSVLVSLTKRGEQALEKMRKKQLGKFSAIVRYMSTGDIEQIIRIHKSVLKKIEENKK